MHTTKQQILSEIKRLAQENGAPPGIRLFESETGIKESDWQPRIWIRWNDAIKEAGFTPNEWGVKVWSDDALLEQYALLARKLNKLPVHGELIVESQKNPNFPSTKPFRRFTKDSLIRALRSFCEERSAFADVAKLCAAWIGTKPSEDSHDINPTISTKVEGYAYLFRHGKTHDYKIGCSDDPDRRRVQLSPGAPHGLIIIHTIKTDDMFGIERYWKERFKDQKCKTNEWYTLNASDVKAFKRWRKIY